VSTVFAQDDLPQGYKLLMEQFDNIKPEDIKKSSVTGLLEVSFDGTLLYATEDGRFLIQGDAYDVVRKVNVTEQQRAVTRAEALTNADPDTMIVFDVADGNPDYSITVFTDIDCGYCRKLHREIAAYNEAGIRVQYMFFPRSGPNTASWTKANNVWYSDDRAAALTRAKSGEVLPDADCGETPVERHYKLGLAAGVTGTPAIMTEKGVLISGYVPAPELRERLDTLSEVPAAN
jgi:thiol:disulfide interchange protein DsbC